MAEASGLNQNASVRIWRAFGLKPHLQENFKLSTDPFLVEKVRDLVGLDLHPPEQTAARWCGVWMKKVRCRRSIAAHPCGRCGPARPSGAPLITTDTAPLRSLRRWTSPPGRSSGAASSRTGSRSSCASWIRSSAPCRRAWTSIWCWTTTPRTKRRRFQPGSRNGRAAICTSPPPAVRGSTRWSAGLPKLPSNASGAACAKAWINSSPPSMITARLTTALPTLVWSATADLILDRLTTLRRRTTRSPH